MPGLTPIWRKPWEWDVRGRAPGRGRKMASPRSVAPCRGFVNLEASPTDHAMGNFLPLLRASIRSIPRPPPFKSHAQFGLSYCSAACRMRIMFGGADDRFLSSAAAAGLEEAGSKNLPLMPGSLLEAVRLLRDSRAFGVA